MSRIEQIITEIEDYIDSCKFQPLSNTKILVNKEEIEELLVELRLRIPEEIKKYQKIISNQDAILQEARSQADAMVAEATAQTNELVNEHEDVYKRQVYVIEGPEGKEYLFPSIKECILNVDLEAGTVTVHIMDGLLDL